MHEPTIRPRPRILIVTPEITCLPRDLGPGAERVQAKAGGLADATASLVAGLRRQGADVHVAVPNYRRLFDRNTPPRPTEDPGDLPEPEAEPRFHLADDAIFHDQDRVYRSNPDEALYAALAFQREVIHRIIPAVQPDLVHCNDWMTALIPAAVKNQGIKSLFTLHNVHSRDTSLHQIAAAGIGGHDFWRHLYYGRPPGECQQARWHGTIQLLASGVFAADHVNTVSPGFLRELAEGIHRDTPGSIRAEIVSKQAAGRASGVLNAPDPSFDPADDPVISRNYSARCHARGKAANKTKLQELLGLETDPEATVFFWPSRLDPSQKGPELLAQILHRTVSDYWHHKLQMVAVADGPYQHYLRRIVDDFRLHSRVTVRDFDECLTRQAYAGADFMLMPSRFEPCGLPQMIAPLYGCLPVVHATGGLRDTVRHLDVDHSTGNGFRFEDADGNGLRWAIDQAMIFHARPEALREREIRRIMRQSRDEFDPAHFIRRYTGLYENLLGRSVIQPPETPPVRKKRRAPVRKAARATDTILPQRAIPAA